MTPVPALWPESGPCRLGAVRVDRFLVVAVLVSTALRVPGLLATPSSDEAGFPMVARSWSPSADSLYGRYWVDRPPVLLAAYRWTDGLLGAARAAAAGRGAGRRAGGRGAPARPPLVGAGAGAAGHRRRR